MKVSSHALFQAVVIMGTGLLACQSPSAPGTGDEHGDVPRRDPIAPIDEVSAEPTNPTEVSGNPRDTAGLAPDGAESAVASDVPESSSLALAEESAGTGDTDPLDVVGIQDHPPSKKKPAKRTGESPRCPKGSEMPYPPCFYIL